MNYKYLASGIVLGALGLTTPVYAQGEELDIIMDVVEEGDDPSEIIQRLELPPPMNAVANVPELETIQGPNLNELQLQTLRDDVEALLQDADSTVSDAVNDALANGNVNELLDLLDDQLPPDVIEDLTTDIEDLTNDLVDDITDDVDNLTDDVDDLTEELDDLTNDIDDVTDDVDDITDDVNDLADEIGGDIDSATDDLNDAIDDLPLETAPLEELPLEDLNSTPLDILPASDALNQELLN